MIQVKKSDGRSEKARLTRGRILDAAGELFVRDGYGATALQDIATKAGCAVQTIYYSFGNKQTVLKELVDRTIAVYDEPVATLDRPWFRDALAAETAQEQLRRHVSGTRAVLESGTDHEDAGWPPRRRIPRSGTSGRTSRRTRASPCRPRPRPAC